MARQGIGTRQMEQVKEEAAQRLNAPGRWMGRTTNVMKKIVSPDIGTPESASPKTLPITTGGVPAVEHRF